jgi:hypothetical protein
MLALEETPMSKAEFAKLSMTPQACPQCKAFDRPNVAMECPKCNNDQALSLFDVRIRVGQVVKEGKPDKRGRQRTKNTLALYNDRILSPEQLEQIKPHLIPFDMEKLEADASVDEQRVLLYEDKKSGANQYGGGQQYGGQQYNGGQYPPQQQPMPQQQGYVPPQQGYAVPYGQNGQVPNQPAPTDNGGGQHSFFPNHGFQTGQR